VTHITLAAAKLGRLQRLRDSKMLPLRSSLAAVSEGSYHDGKPAPAPSAYSKTTTDHGTPARQQQMRRLAAPRFLNGPREHSAPELRTGASRV